MSESPTKTNRWYKVRNNLSQTLYYARKGFGEDGSMVAVLEIRDPHCTGWRFTSEHMKQNYTIIGVCADSDAIESRFQFELHR